MSNILNLRYGSGSLALNKSSTLAAVHSGSLLQHAAENQIASRSGSYQIRNRSDLGNIRTLGAGTRRDSKSFESTIDRLLRPAEITNVYHSSPDMVPFVPTGTVYLEFHETADEQTRNDLITRHHLKLVRREFDGGLTLRADDHRLDAVEVCTALQQEPSVRIAEPDLSTEGEVKGFAAPNDALIDHEWYLENTGRNGGEASDLKAGADARVIAAWRLLQGLGSLDVVIGIIDDGFDLSHPDLAARSVHPWDFARNAANVSPEPNLTSPQSGNWHGTACAGIAIGAAGAGNIVGAAPGCSWIPVRWSSLEPIEIAKWFDYMRERGASIVSCSWGARATNYPLSTRVAKAISRCATEGREGKGSIIVFAAGNEGRDVNDPAHNSVNGFAVHPDVVAVGASDSLDEHASYSNTGKEIWICAPSSSDSGRGVTTADVTGEFIDSIGATRPLGYVPGDYNEHFGKTSSSCPLVAGICGLVLSANPGLTAAECREILKQTARRIGDPGSYDADGHSRLFGYGCVHAEAAVAEANTRLLQA